MVSSAPRSDAANQAPEGSASGLARPSMGPPPTGAVNDGVPAWHVDSFASESLGRLVERFWDGRAWTEKTRSALDIDEFPESWLGPIDPSLQELINSFERDHSRRST